MTLEQLEAQRKEEQEKDKAIQELKKAVDEKDKEREGAGDEEEELERTYDTIPIRREMAEVQTAVAGTQSHFVVGWLGRLLLIVGLLVLMLQSEGLRQKVILIVLLVVMFSALSGVNLDFLAQGRMGGSAFMAPRATERAPEATRTPEATPSSKP